eukprot:2002092-Rhodomonas_salina.2
MVTAGPDGSPCLPCVPGTYKSIYGSAPCKECAAGLYSNVEAAVLPARCRACPANSDSSRGSVQAGCLCDLGFTGSDGGPCAACAVGTYKEVNGSSACSACPAASSSPAASVVITDCICNPGFFGPDGQACRFCVPGQYKVPSPSRSRPCYVVNWHQS